MGLKRAAHHDVSRAHLVGDPQNKKPKFDHRNPSTLAQDAPDEDAILDLDEIGRGGQQSKRNAVRLEGYESDSSNENFDARADEKVKQAAKEKREAKSKDEEEEEEEENDMFADIEENENPDGDDDEELAREGKKRKKEVRFLDTNEIEGQVGSSHGGGHVSADFSMTPKDSSWKQSESSGEASDSSDGEHGDAQRDQVDSDVDDELGAGAKKKHAPRLDGFNMRSEAEEGRFDSTGNFVRNAKDPFEVHDAYAVTFTFPFIPGSVHVNTLLQMASRQQQQGYHAQGGPSRGGQRTGAPGTRFKRRRRKYGRAPGHAHSTNEP